MPTGASAGDTGGITKHVARCRLAVKQKQTPGILSYQKALCSSVAATTVEAARSKSTTAGRWSFMASSLRQTTAPSWLLTELTDKCLAVAFSKRVYVSIRQQSPRQCCSHVCGQVAGCPGALFQCKRRPAVRAGHPRALLRWRSCLAGQPALGLQQRPRPGFPIHREGVVACTSVAASRGLRWGTVALAQGDLPSTRIESQEGAISNIWCRLDDSLILARGCSSLHQRTLNSKQHP
eukprot:scaffold7461_cov417-Prasinococcus_capsulatus_cf.AAC.2